MFSLTLDTLAADFEVMMVCAGLGDDQGAQADGGELVGVVDHVIVTVPGDHHDGGLQCELHAGLGEHGEAAEHTGSGNVLKLGEVLLPPDDGDQVPGDQRHGEQQRAEQHRPGEWRLENGKYSGETDQNSHSLICSDRVPGRSPWRRE